MKLLLITVIFCYGLSTVFSSISDHFHKRHIIRSDKAKEITKSNSDTSFSSKFQSNHKLAHKAATLTTAQPVTPAKTTEPAAKPTTVTPTKSTNDSQNLTTTSNKTQTENTTVTTNKSDTTTNTTANKSLNSTTNTTTDKSLNTTTNQSIIPIDSLPITYNTEYNGVQVWVWVVIILILIVILTAITIIYVKYSKREIYENYSQNPEDGIPRNNLGISDTYKLSKWKINQDKEKQAVDVKQEDKKNLQGSYIELKFTQISGTINTIMAEQSIKNKEFAYFEIEIEDNPKNSDVVIGLCNDKEYLPTLDLGRSATSVGFHSASGKVEQAGKVLYDHDIKAVYGETLGIGMRWSDGRIWLTYNGRFLNPPPRNERKKKGSDDEGPVAVQMVFDPKEKKNTEDEIKRKISIPHKKPLFPCISSDGPVKINLNIGGQPFRMNQKELKKGLI